MNRSLPQLLDQRISALPQRKTYTASVYAVLLPSRQLVVNFPGHSRVIADVGNEVDLGTQQLPLVSRGMVVKVTLDDVTGHWIASSPQTSNVCIPTTPNNIPNVPLPVYRPPIPYFPPPIFPPTFPPIPPITLPPWIPPTTLPPVTLPPGTTGIGTDKTPRIISAQYVPDLPGRAGSSNNYGYLHVDRDLLAYLSYGFTGGSSSYIYLYDVSYAPSPVLLSRTVIADSGGTGNVRIAGKYLYAMIGVTLHIYDISDPHSPSSVSATTTQYYNGNMHLFSVGSSRYIVFSALNSGNEVVEVYDVTTPASPSLVGTSATTNSSSTWTVGYGTNFYIQDDNGTDIHIVDCSTPASPTIAGTILGAGYGEMSATQGYLYLAQQSNINVVLYNVSTPASPILVSTISVDSADSNPFPTGIFSEGRFVYVLNYGTINSVVVFDYKTPASPVKVGGGTPTFDPAMEGIWVSGNHIFFKSVNFGTGLALEVMGV